jgi:trehalose 6-phosphate phosphatase
MKHILAAANAGLLAQLAWSRVLLAFDFDGTLAPIVADRDEAAMRAKTRSLLTAACGIYPTAIISGRGQRDVAARLRGIGVKYIVGNHGIEPGPNIVAFERDIRAVSPILARDLGDLQGVEIEDKRYSLTVHYRHARRKREARIAIARSVAALPRPMRVISGKLVANVVPVGARDKGDILLELRDRASADVALYVGDDVTDEDVFTIDQPGRLLSIRVGKSARTAARFYLRDQREIDRLLSCLVTLRKRGRRDDAR